MAVRGSARKDRILRAAAELFAADGYHGVGMSQLEQAVGLQRGALYHHIGNKEALLFEISTAPLREMVRIASEIAARVDDEEQRFRELSRAILGNVATRRLEWTVHYRDWNALTGDRLDTVLALRREYENVWLDTLRSGIARGVFRPTDEPIAIKGILGMFNYSWVWLSVDGDREPDRIADLFADIFLAGIRAG